MNGSTPIPVTLDCHAAGSLLKGVKLRIWFSGPRLFGLVRPGISFALSELTKRAKPKVIVPREPDPEPPEQFKDLSPHIQWLSFIIFGLAIYGFFSMTSCAINLAHAGTCHNYQDGGQTVQSCEDGTFTVRNRDGKVRQYGERNGGFERYPGQEGRPVFERR